MTVQLIIDNVPVPITWVNFSDGGTNCKLEIPELLVKHPPAAYFSISVDPSTPVDRYLWEILAVESAVNNTFPKGFNRMYLQLPYLPHGRADRVFENGNGFPLEIFMQTVMDKFTNFHFTDPHSNYGPALVRSNGLDVDIRTQSSCFLETTGRQVQTGDLLIAPDEGASKKIYQLFDVLKVRNVHVDVIEATKTRDLETGRVTSTQLPAYDYAGRTVWIVDDILDGGGTFIPLAAALKEQGVGKVNLFVTHGIFSKGFEPFNGLIDEFHVYQCIGSYVNEANIKFYNKQQQTRVATPSN